MPRSTKLREPVAQNRAAYESPDVIAYFRGLHDLQPPERAVLDRFVKQWGEWTFLDLGVGAGRTTQHFAPLVRRYVGVDYAKGMVDLCRERFGETAGKMEFLQADARELTQFDDNAFDFVLFSYNGIDYVTHEDRLRVLMAVRRVLQPSGYFMFSTHNLNFDVRQLFFPLKLHRNPLETLRRIRAGSLFRMTNREYRYPLASDHALINDGAHDFRLSTYYVKPTAQVTELERAGFTNVHAMTIGDGALLDVQGLASNCDPWVYYLAQAAK